MFTDEHALRFHYHYTTAHAFLTYILPSLRLKLSVLAAVNDPRESRDWTCSVSGEPGDDSSEMPSTEEFFAYQVDFTRRLRDTVHVACFAATPPDLNYERQDHRYGHGYAHPSMWDRYAGGHSGVCLMLDIRELRADFERSVGADGRIVDGPVNYGPAGAEGIRAYNVRWRAILDKGIDAAMRQHRESHWRELYFRKSADWRTEFEYRYVLLNDGAPGDKFVDVSSSLKGVIFGDLSSPDAIATVKATLGEGVQYARVFYQNGYVDLGPA